MSDHPKTPVRDIVKANRRILQDPNAKRSEILLASAIIIRVSRKNTIFQKAILEKNVLDNGGVTKANDGLKRLFEKAEGGTCVLKEEQLQ